MIKLLSSHGANAIIVYQGKEHQLRIKMKRDIDGYVWISAISEMEKSFVENRSYLGIPLDNNHVMIKNYDNQKGILELLIGMGLVRNPEPVANSKLFIVFLTDKANSLIEEADTTTL